MGRRAMSRRARGREAVSDVTATRVWRRSFARALALAVLAAGTLALASPASAAGPTTLGVSGWQVYSNLGIYANPAPAGIHGNPLEYAAAPAIPAQGDPGWADCGPSSPLRTSPYAGTRPLCPSAATIGMGVGSILPGCWSGLNFTSFQALVSIPSGTTISQFSVNMSGADDGARISLVNSLNPSGITPPNGFIHQGTPQSTGNLAAYVAAGEVNRVVITQVDDCAVGNNLNVAQVLLNGSVVPPKPKNTAPTVAVSGVTDGASYEIGQVPAAGCVATDAEDGPSQPDAVLSALAGPLAQYGAGSQTVTCSVTDAGGLSASATATYSIVDTTRPGLSGAPTSAPNGAGWYKSAVTIHWTATDSGTGIDPATTPADSVLAGDGANQTASASVADRAGNTTSAVSAPAVNIDRTAPTVAFSGQTAYGLLDTVNITCAASDALSGIATSTCASTSGPAWSFGPGVKTRTAGATDKAGNSASATTSFEVNATASSLCALVAVFTDHNGTRTSLCAHLTDFERSSARGQAGPAAAQLQAFRTEATARSGKQLTAAQVATLIGWANTL